MDKDVNNNMTFTMLEEYLFVLTLVVSIQYHTEEYLGGWGGLDLRSSFF